MNYFQYEDILQLPLTDLDGVKNHYWYMELFQNRIGSKKIMSMLLEKESKQDHLFL